MTDPDGPGERPPEHFGDEEGSKGAIRPALPLRTGAPWTRRLSPMGQGALSAHRPRWPGRPPACGGWWRPRGRSGTRDLGAVGRAAEVGSRALRATTSHQPRVGTGLPEHRPAPLRGAGVAAAHQVPGGHRLCEVGHDQRRSGCYRAGRTDQRPAGRPIGPRFSTQGAWASFEEPEPSYLETRRSLAGW